MAEKDEEEIEITFAENKKAVFKFAGRVGNFFAPISGNLGEYPSMWFSNKTWNDTAIALYLKGYESEIPNDSIQFLNHFFDNLDYYKQLAIKALVSFGNLDWNTDQFTTNEEDWTLLSLLYFGEGPGIGFKANFGMAFYPNEKRWIDIYCQWFVTFYNGRLVGVNRVQW
jgi:hypothetical protein